METKELYLIGNKLASERDLKIEDLKVAHAAVWMRLTPCLLMHLLMVLYLFTGSDRFQSIQCNKCKTCLPGTLEIVDPALPHARTHTCTEGAKRVSLHSPL